MRPVQRSLVALVLVAIALVVFAPLVLGGKTWDDTRYHTEIAPPRIAAADAVLGGQLPAWWEGSGLGVPLLGEPSHGAAYPLGWIAATPHALDLVLILHALWCALGIALWARRLGASELGALVAAVLAMASGIVASAALRGALPALAHLPWIGLAASHVAAAPSRQGRARWTAALAILVGLVGLAGQLAVLVQALALATVVLVRRWPWLVTATAAGLAIASVQWLPALFVLGGSAGASHHALDLVRVVELVVPLRSDAGWFPSLYIGAPLLALAVLARPRARLAILAIVLAALAIACGRGGWPHWLGAPELHVAALALVAAAHAGAGFDVLLAGERRAYVALGGAAVAIGIALAALAGLGDRFAPDVASAGGMIDRARISGGLALACTAGALLAAWRLHPSARHIDPRSLILAVLVVGPSVGAAPVVAPTIERAIVDEAPDWVEKAIAPSDFTVSEGRTTTAQRGPQRVFRPIMSFTDSPNPVHDMQTLADAIATLAGTSAAKWGIGAARSEDPARPPDHDRVWLGAAAAGGQLLDRYSIALAIVPGSMVAGRSLAHVATRGGWSLVRYPASPSAALVYEWLFVPDVDSAIARLFPPGANRGLGSGLVVLHGDGVENQDEPRAAQPCTIERWTGGAIDVRCTADRPAYAVVSSTAADGWEVEIDGRASPWLVADVMRRAVAVPAGEHHIAWRYHARGLVPALVFAALGLVALLALRLWLGRVSTARNSDAERRAPDPDEPDVN